ncbi:hypothetical protein AMJ47_02045 [Parcubacteria bacterium DG_72]|nr:MAG: hypothetical protein AMJ47_02045 [Parcubacteria bacterium DG_72]
MSKKKVKKFVFPGLALITSIWISAVFAVGAVAGYITTNIFLKKLVETGKIKNLILVCERRHFHIHHWIVGIFIVLMGFISQLIYTVPIFWLGFVGGLIFHDIHTDKKWHKVVYKKPSA